MISLVLLSLISTSAWACFPASGGISKTATLHFFLSPPPKYTYSSSPALGQTSTAKAAEANVDKDLRAAILSTLTENGIPTESATLNYEYKAPKLLLAEGSHCQKADTYIVYHGTVVYKCVEEMVAAAKVRGKREVSTSSTIEMSTVTSENESTTENPTTEPITEGETTPDPEGTTPESETTPDTEPITDNTATTLVPNPEVRSEQYEIFGSVVVETPQPVFESQWNTLAEKIQEKLEKQRVIFTENIRVELI